MAEPISSPSELICYTFAECTLPIIGIIPSYIKIKKVYSSLKQKIAELEQPNPSGQAFPDHLSSSINGIKKKSSDLIKRALICSLLRNLLVSPLTILLFLLTSHMVKFSALVALCVAMPYLLPVVCGFYLLGGLLFGLTYCKGKLCKGKLSLQPVENSYWAALGSWATSRSWVTLGSITPQSNTPYMPDAHPPIVASGQPLFLAEGSSSLTRHGFFL